MKAPKITIIASKFNGEITHALVTGAYHFLNNLKLDARLVNVPGAFELPIAASHAIANGDDGIIALGCVIRGDTDHFDFVCQGCTDGLMRLMLDTGVPIGFGVLMTNTLQQACDRASTDHFSVATHSENESTVSNKGYEAAQAVIETLVAIDTITR